MPAVAHLYAHENHPTGGVTTNRELDPTGTSGGGAGTSNPSNILGHRRPGSITEVDENTDDTDGDDAGDGQGGGEEAQGEGEGSAARAAELKGQSGDADLSKEAEAAAGKLLAGAAKEREDVMSMSTVVLQEAKRNNRFRFFSEER